MFQMIPWFHKQEKILIFLYWLLLFVVVLYRVTLGVDVSDESYYVTFLDEWLKTGFRQAHNLMLHQTAALLLFPFVFVYTHIVGNEMGLMLFLRCLYVVVSFGAMMTLYFFLSRWQTKVIAALVAGISFLFIPFSAPALSYNTIGLFGFITALCSFGMIILELDQPAPVNDKLFFLSVLAFTCAIIAHPTFIPVFLLFIGVAYFLLKNEKERAFLKNYTYLCFCCFAFFFLLLIAILGLNHLLAILDFTNTANGVEDGLATKWILTAQHFSENKTFLVLCLSAFILGLGKVFLGEKEWYKRTFYLFCCAVGWYCITTPLPFLFVISHDFIFIWALFGVYIPCESWGRSKSISPVIKILYIVSFLSGFILATTATHCLYNFFIGGALAAYLSLACYKMPSLYQSDKFERLPIIIILVAANLFMINVMYSYMYGERFGNPFMVSSIRIKQGMFAGLRTSTSMAELYIKPLTQLLPQTKTNSSLVVIGCSLPGAYILTSLSSKALSTWDLGTDSNSLNYNKMKDFYNKETNRPDYLLRYIGITTHPLTDLDKFLLTKYTLNQRIELAEGFAILLYQKTNEHHR